MRLIEQAAQAAASIGHKSDALHANIIGALDGSERFINHALKATRTRIDAMQRATQKRVTDTTRRLERLRPNKVRLP